MVMKIIQDEDFITKNMSCENHLDTCIRLGGDSGATRKGPSPPAPPTPPPPNNSVNKITEDEDLWGGMEYSSEKDSVSYRVTHFVCDKYGKGV